MKYFFYTILVLTFSVLFIACSKEEGCTDQSATNYNPNAEKNDGSCTYTISTPEETGTFKLNFEAKITGGQPLVINQPYSDSTNYTLQVEGFKFYISNLTLVKTNDQEVNIKDVDLINFNATGENYTSAKALIGDYKAIKFGLGVDSILNGTDPTSFPNDHPLSLFQNTYWNWSSQYRFVMLEGRADTVNGSSSNLDQLLIYHTGINSLYREYQKNINFSIQLNTTHQEDLTISLNEVFYGSAGNIDLKTESVTHTTSNYALALKFTENFITAIK